MSKKVFSLVFVFACLAPALVEAKSRRPAQRTSRCTCSSRVIYIDNGPSPAERAMEELQRERLGRP